MNLNTLRSIPFLAAAAAMILTACDTDTLTVMAKQPPLAPEGCYIHGAYVKFDAINTFFHPDTSVTTQSGSTLASAETITAPSGEYIQGYFYSAAGQHDTYAEFTDAQGATVSTIDFSAAQNGQTYKKYQKFSATQRRSLVFPSGTTLAKTAMLAVYFCPLPPEDPMLMVDQEPGSVTGSLIVGADDVTLMRFTADATESNVDITALTFVSGNSFSLDNAQNYTLWADTNGDAAVDIQVLSGIHPVGGSVSFAPLADTTVVEATDRVFEVHADVADTLTGATPKLQLVFGSGASFVEAQDAASGTLLQGVEKDGLCSMGSGCHIMVHTNISTEYALLSQPEPPTETGSFVRNLDNLELGLSTHATHLLWQEDSTLVALNRATSDGQSVGFIVDEGTYAHEIAAGSATRRPTLQSGSGYNSFVTFDGTADYMTVLNSKDAFNFIHAGQPFTIAAWVKVNADNTNMALLDSNGQTASNAGMTLMRSSNNRLQFMATKGSGLSYINHTTANTNDGKLTVSDGWTQIIVKSDGTVATIQIGSAAPETMTINSANAGSITQSALGALAVGGKTNVGVYWNGSIGNILITSDSLTTQELADFASYNPARTHSSQAYAKTSGTTLDPTQLSHLYTHWDMADVSTLTTDKEGTTAVAVDNDPIGRVADTRNARIGRNAAAAANDTSRPLFHTDVVNGLDGVLWDGVNDNLSFAPWARGGAFTLIFAARNLDTGTGSHFFRLGGSAYIVQTGSGYEWGNNQDARFVIHTNGTVTNAYQYGQDAGVGESMDGDAWHVYTITRDANVVTLRVDGHVSGSSPITETNQFNPNQMGQSGHTHSWWLYGNIGEVAKYNVRHSDVDIAKVERAMAEKFGIDY